MSSGTLAALRSLHSLSTESLVPLHFQLPPTKNLPWPAILVTCRVQFRLLLLMVRKAWPLDGLRKPATAAGLCSNDAFIVCNILLGVKAVPQGYSRRAIRYSGCRRNVIAKCKRQLELPPGTQDDNGQRSTECRIDNRMLALRYDAMPLAAQLMPIGCTLGLGARPSSPSSSVILVRSHRQIMLLRTLAMTCCPGIRVWCEALLGKARLGHKLLACKPLDAAAVELHLPAVLSGKCEATKRPEAVTRYGAHDTTVSGATASSQAGKRFLTSEQIYALLTTCTQLTYADNRTLLPAWQCQSRCGVPVSVCVLNFMCVAGCTSRHILWLRELIYYNSYCYLQHNPLSWCMSTFGLIRVEWCQFCSV